MHAPLPPALPDRVVITINFTRLQTTVHKIQEFTCFVNIMEPFQNTLIQGKMPVIGVVVYLTRDIKKNKTLIGRNGEMSSTCTIPPYLTFKLSRHLLGHHFRQVSLFYSF